MNKGRNTTAPIEFSKAEEVLRNLLKEKSKYAIFWAVSIYTGLRVSDVLSLTWEQLLSPQGKVDIVEKKRGKNRTIIINKKLLTVINRTRNGQTGLILKNKFGNKMSIKSVNQAIRNILFENRINHVNQSSHMLRKTFATKIYNDTRDIMLVSRILNHNSVATTMAYIGVWDEEIQNVYKSL